MLLCKFCGKECKNNNSLRNHERLCPSNTNRVYMSHTQGKPAWNKGLDISDSRIEQQAIASRGKHRTPHSDATKLKLSGIAKQRGFGGYQPNAGRSKKFKVYDSFGNQTTLQSTYEYAVFETLCELEIRWIRPKALKYDGKNYFGDFHLVDFDVYLDPKNDYKAKQDAAKIKAVCEQNNVRLYVLTEQQINKNTIASVIQ